MTVVGLNLGDDQLDRRLAGNGTTFTPIYTAVKNVCYTLSLRRSSVEIVIQFELLSQ